MTLGAWAKQPVVFRTMPAVARAKHSLLVRAMVSSRPSKQAGRRYVPVARAILRSEPVNDKISRRVGDSIVYGV